jgi:hypothetical protein
MSDKKVGSSGSWDAKINAKPKAKDAVGKAMGYEDAGAQKREDGHLQKTSKTSDQQKQ